MITVSVEKMDGEIWGNDTTLLPLTIDNLSEASVRCNLAYLPYEQAKDLMKQATIVLCGA